MGTSADLRSDSTRIDLSPTGRPTAATGGAARGSVAQLGAFVVTAGLNYGFAVLMSWLLPVGQYGMLGVLQALYLLSATAVSAGFPWALTRALARADSSSRARLFRGALAGNVCFGAGLAMLLTVTAERGWFGLDAAYRGPTLLLAVTVVVMAVSAVMAAALQGLLHVSAVALVRITEVAVKFGAGTILVLLGGRTFGAMVGFLIGVASAAVLAAALLRTARLGGTRGWALRAATEGAGPFFIGFFGLAVLVNADIVGLKLFGSPTLADTQTGPYQAAVTLARLPVFVVLAVLNAVFPFVALHAEGSGLSGVYARLATKYTFLLILPFNVVLIVIPGLILDALFAPVYGVAAASLAAAAVGTLLLTVGHLFTILLQAMGQLRLTATALVMAAVLEVACLAWLVPPLGMLGAALGLISAGGLLVVVLAPAALRTFALTLPLRSALAYALAVFVLASGSALVPHEGRMVTIVLLLALACVYFILLVSLGLLTSRDVKIVTGGLDLPWAPVIARVSCVKKCLSVVSRGDDQAC